MSSTQQKKTEQAPLRAIFTVGDTGVEPAQEAAEKAGIFNINIFQNK
jgi:hypothetical protein